MTVSLGAVASLETKPTTEASVTVGQPLLLGVGTGVSETSYPQQELLDLFDISDAKIRSVFANSGIGQRFLTLPPVGADGTRSRGGR